MRVDQRQQRRCRQAESHPQACLHDACHHDDDKGQEDQPWLIGKGEAFREHLGGSAAGISHGIVYPAAVWRILSGSQVARSGKKISTNTISTMIRNMGKAAREMKLIS
jgi:hypothetical protein